ncbi:MAG: DUF805 domain-containing protein [Hyphomicrobiales bacterium]
MSKVPVQRNLFWMFFSFYGRASRREYWWAQLLLFALFGSAIALLNSSGVFGTPDMSGFAFLAVFAVTQILWFLGICVAVKRVHDLGWRGGMAVFLFVPILGIVFWLFLGFREGNPSDNAYGPAPKSREQKH